jgi:NAD(P)H-hydrate epimerase
VVCGKGNNGGDGFVIARAAAKDGWNVTVLLAEGEPKTSDAIRNFECLHSLPVHICTDDSVLETQSFAAVVDALYGTGFHGELRPSGLATCGLIRHLHKGGAFVLAVDLPSGINTDTGEVADGAAHADLTVTFDSYKPLHIAKISAPLCGKIVCADIGIRDEWHPEF